MKRLVADVPVWVAGLVLGAVTAFGLHYLWYYYLLSRTLPSYSPLYMAVAPVMQVAPHVAAGVVSGLILGSRGLWWPSLLFRLSAAFILGAALATRDPYLAAVCFAPSAALAFFVSATLSGVRSNKRIEQTRRR